MKKIILAGGSGFLGKELIRHFQKHFRQIVVLTRGGEKNEDTVVYRHWDAKTKGDWCDDIEDAFAVINLCGKSVDCRYTKKNKAEIVASRVDSTKIIGEAILSVRRPPKVWVNGSSTGIYEYSETIPMTESTGIVGSDFSAEVCRAWEEVVKEFDLPHTRKINLRISLALGKSGGVLPVLQGLVKKRLGGTIGKGTQQVSWIHIEDLCRAVEWLMNNNAASGPYNLVSPNPVRNKNFMALLRQAAGVRFGMPAASWMVEIGAFFLRTETELILKSRYSYPEKLLQEGFRFKYPTIEEALVSFTD